MSENEDYKTCDNCQRDIPTLNFVIHSLYCKKHIKRCPFCDDPFPENELKKHYEVDHSPVKCPKCSAVVTSGKKLGAHYDTKCPLTVVSCQYCELELPRGDMSAHESYCGTRTEICECGTFVMYKYLKLHKDSNHTFVKLDDECGPITRQNRSNNGTEDKAKNMTCASSQSQNQLLNNTSKVEVLKNKQYANSSMSNQSVRSNENSKAKILRSKENDGMQSSDTNRFHLNNLMQVLDDTRVSFKKEEPSGSTTKDGLHSKVVYNIPSLLDLPSLDPSNFLAKRTNDMPQVNCNEDEEQIETSDDPGIRQRYRNKKSTFKKRQAPQPNRNPEMTSSYTDNRTFREQNNPNSSNKNKNYNNGNYSKPNYNNRNCNNRNYSKPNYNNPNYNNRNYNNRKYDNQNYNNQNIRNRISNDPDHSEYENTSGNASYKPKNNFGRRNYNPQPPSNEDPKRERQYESALLRAQQEEKSRETQNAYNIANNVPRVWTVAEKVDMLRKMSALQNAEQSQPDYSKILSGRVWQASGNSSDGGRRLGAVPKQRAAVYHSSSDSSGEESIQPAAKANTDVMNFSKLKPMTQEEMDRRLLERNKNISSSKVGIPATRRWYTGNEPEHADTDAANNDIRTGLTALRRNLNEVIAPLSKITSNDVINRSQNAKESIKHVRANPANLHQTTSSKPKRTPVDVAPAASTPGETRIPCEFCGTLIELEDLVIHETGCRPDLAKFDAKREQDTAHGRNVNRRDNHRGNAHRLHYGWDRLDSDDDDDRNAVGAAAAQPNTPDISHFYKESTIPCENCNRQIAFSGFMAHQMNCI